MSKESKFIKIPKDFQSLNDLTELVQNYDFVSRLSNALNGYHRAYIESYLMTMEEVLDYIPKSQYDKYELHYRGSEIWQYGVDESFCEKLLRNNNPGLKMYMVNTKKKSVDIQGWVDGYKKILTRIEQIEFDIDSRRKRETPFTYKGNHKFIVDIKTRRLEVQIPYIFTDHQAVGGCQISTGHGFYLSGHSMEPYLSNGYDIFYFCTRTNKYLGYGGNWEAERRPWISKTSRY